MNRLRIKYQLSLILSMAIFSFTWAASKPVSSPQAKMKMVMEKVHQNQKYDSWNSQNKVLREANTQRMSMQQRLSMFLGRNPNVAQFFELYKQSVSKEISLHKNLSSATWQILPDLRNRVKQGKATREEWVLLAQMNGYLENLDAKVDAYKSAHKISALNREEEEDLARTLKSMNRIVESLDSWSRLLKMSGSKADQKMNTNLKSQTLTSTYRDLTRQSQYSMICAKMHNGRQKLKLSTNRLLTLKKIGHRNYNTKRKIRIYHALKCLRIRVELSLNCLRMMRLTVWLIS